MHECKECSAPIAGKYSQCWACGYQEPHPLLIATLITLLLLGLMVEAYME